MKIIWVNGTSRSDTSGTGSQQNPYATIEKAIEVFQSEDQIRIISGTYTPTDSAVISGKSGSIFAETPGGVFIQPEKTRAHQACVAILDADRFLVQGINILQASDISGNLIGLYVENTSTFLAYTCDVSDFEVPSGNGCGIYGSGALGRIENCRVANFACAGDIVYGIRTKGLDVIDCETTALSGAGDCEVIAIEVEGYA